MAEPIVIMLIEKFNIKRSISALLTGISTWALGILSALSFNILDNTSILGYPNFFTAITEITTDYMLPVGILGFAIFVGWQINEQSIKECLKFKSDRMFKAWYLIVRYVSPIIIILITL